MTPVSPGAKPHDIGKSFAVIAPAQPTIPVVALGLVPRAHSAAAPSLSREARPIAGMDCRDKPGNDRLRKMLGSRERTPRHLARARPGTRKSAVVGNRVAGRYKH